MSLQNLLINFLFLFCHYTGKANLADSIEFRQYSGKIFNNPTALNALKNKISQAGSSLVSIKVLHIGDSHVKSGYFSEPFMEKLNSYYAQKYSGNLFFTFQWFCKTGTKYSDYSDLEELNAQLESESPDLVIISLGTNDAFSGSSRIRFYDKIDHLIKKIRLLSPQSSILITTPPDGLKYNNITGVYTRVPELQDVVRTLVKYANDNFIAYWDLNQLMGGAGSMNIWAERGLGAADRVHFTQKGYGLFANWLFESFINTFERK